MTKKELEEYQKLKTDIKCLENEMQEMLRTDKGIVSDTILDYKTGYPIPSVITGFDQQRYNELRKKLDKKQDRLQRINDFIDNIIDDQTRYVFTLKYKNKKTWSQIANRIGKYDESYPRKLIHDEYLKKIFRKSEKSEKSELE